MRTVNMRAIVIFCKLAACGRERGMRGMNHEIAWIEAQWARMEASNPTQTILDASGRLLECPRIDQRPTGEQVCLTLFEEEAP